MAVNRATPRPPALSAYSATGQDIALSAFNILCPPGPQGTGKFNPRGYEQGEDDGLVVNRITFDTALWDDNGASVGYVFWNIDGGSTTSRPGDFREGQEIVFTSTVEGNVVQKVEVNGIPQEVSPELSAYTYTVGAGPQFVDVSFGQPQVLPYKNEVEYLQSSNGEYINLGIAGRDITRVDFKFAPNAVVSNTYEVFGELNKTYGYSFTKRSNTHMVSVNGSGADCKLTPQFYINEVKDYTVSIQGTDVVINGNSYVAGMTAKQWGLEMVLFGYRSSATGVIGYSNIKLYYFTIWQNGVKAREMIPVIDWQDVPCMYDRVTGVLFYNAGTGEFVPGPVSNSAT